MMSMISEQIEELKEVSRFMNRAILATMSERDDKSTETLRRMSKIVGEAADTIQEFSEKIHTVQMERSIQYYNGGWIPCSERLPEEPGKYYIVTATEGKRAHVTFAKWIARSKYFDMTGTRIYWRVIAWMPLPEPYREEE